MSKPAEHESEGEGMRLWLLRPIDKDSGPWEGLYDRVFGFVIRAETEERARQIAAENAGFENPFLSGHYDKSPWNDAALSTCTPVGDEGEEALIIHDYHAD